VFKRDFFITYKNNTVSFCVATAAVGRVPDGGIKIAIKKDYCTIHDDSISVVARLFLSEFMSTIEPRFSHLSVPQVEVAPVHSETESIN